MKSSIQTALDAGEWRDLLAAAASTFYHDPVWIDSLLAAYPYYRAHHVLVRDDAGRLLGGIPAVLSRRAGLTQLLSLPYGTYGTPVVVATDPEERRAVLELLVREWIRRAARPGTVRAHLVLFEPGPDPDGGRLKGLLEETPAGRLEPEATFVLDLRSGFEALWEKRFSGDRRTECRKAERAGVAVSDETGPGGVAAMESLYRRQARAWRNHTPFPAGLFRNLVERGPERVRVWVARLDGVPVSAEIVFHHQGMTTTWLKCNTPESRATGAGTLLYKAVIEDACARGRSTFNFGGTQGRPSLERFKSGFGAVMAPYWSWLGEPGWFRGVHRLYYRLRGIR